MAGKVMWLGRASDKVRPDLVPGFSRELSVVFPRAANIVVYDVFGGYSVKLESKIVLGVEVRSPDSYHTHVIKLGTEAAVGNDYLGWRKCVLKHNFASRVFESVKNRALPRGRVGIIYEDAFRLFGTLEAAQGPQTLETVCFWAVEDNKPDPVSVERVIRQIYTELYRWFYRTPVADAEAARRFYERRLRRAFDRWADEPWRKELRRDFIWLFCNQDPGAVSGHPRYLDPYDYVGWMFENSAPPQTLVGRSHGDLHGRNILVGVQRGEAEYPAVFDYGEMDDANVLVWDFVKLETELKVRLLMRLYHDAACRGSIAWQVPRQHPGRRSRERGTTSGCGGAPNPASSPDGLCVCLRVGPG